MRCGGQQTDLECFVRLEEVRNALSELVKHTDADTYPIPSQPFGPFLSEWYNYKEKIQRGGAPLFELMAATNDSEATLKRDKIFGLLGLANRNARASIIPDYSEATTDRLLSIRLTMYFLQGSDKLWPLDFAGSNTGSGLPSWVADWTAPGSMILNDSTRQVTEGKSNRVLLKHKFEPELLDQDISDCPEPRALVLSGKVLDKVTDVSTLCLSDEHQIKAGIREWELQLQHKWRHATFSQKAEHWGGCSTQSPTDGKDVSILAFKQNFICQLLPSEHPYMSKLVTNLKKWTRGIEDCEGCLGEIGKRVEKYEGWLNSGTCEEIEALGAAIQDFCWGRTLYLTDHGWCTDSPRAVAVNDALCQIAGSESPIVLKPAGEYWNLVSVERWEYHETEVNDWYYWFYHHEYKKRRRLGPTIDFRIR